MLEIFQYKFMWRAILASVFGGASCGIVGVWVILLGIPFVGVAMSHAAFAGAIVGLLFGFNPLASAIIFCLISSLFIGPMAEKADFSFNTSVGIIFSFTLGIAFMGLGLIKGPKTEALNYIWGSILTISDGDCILLLAIFACLSLFLVCFYKEIRAVLFNCEIARASGMPEKFIFYSLLLLCAMTVSLNLNTIGGLLIFSLIIAPPSAAYQLTYNLKMMFLLSALFGVASCLAGLFFSYLFNVPCGAVIITCASLIFVVCLVFSPKRKVKLYEQA